MKCLRACESGQSVFISDCLNSYPFLSTLIAKSYDYDCDTLHKLVPIRDHAIELARVESYELELAGWELQCGHDFTVLRRKQLASRHIYRIAPGKTGSVSAIRDATGQILTEGEAIAHELCRHWSLVFASRGVDKVKLDEWLDDGILHRPLSLLRAFSKCGIDQIDTAIGKAIKFIANSQPRPDGICFAAWRALGPLGRATLRDTPVDMASDEVNSSCDMAEPADGTPPVGPHLEAIGRDEAHGSLRFCLALT